MNDLFNLNTYFRFLSQHKLYSFITIFGFAIALAFVLLLSVYVKQELSVDNFHENKDHIYLLTSVDTQDKSLATIFANPVADYVKERFPEIRTYTRIVSFRNYPYVQAIEYRNRKTVINALFVDAPFFTMFSFPLVEGDPSKVFESEASAVISESFAKQIFHDEDPVGKSVRFAGQDVMITGIIKNFPQNTHISESDIIFNYPMLKYAVYPTILENWGDAGYPIYFRTEPGTDLPSKAPILLEDLKKDFWIYEKGYADDLMFLPLEDIYFSGLDSRAGPKTNSKTHIAIYTVIAFLILIVAMLNYINLSISQAGSRGKEAAVKKLLGCRKGKLILQFTGESLIMTTGAFLVGVLLAFVAEPFFNDVLSTRLNLKEQFDFSFTLLLIFMVLLTGFLSGIFPALAISRFEPIEIVKGSFSQKVKMSYSKVLISFQYFVAGVLLICSIFIVRQTNYMRNYDLGFDSEHLFVVNFPMSEERLPGLRDKLEMIPGVEKVSFTSGTPLDGGMNHSFSDNGKSLSFQTFAIDSVFFDLFGMEVTPTGIPPTKRTVWMNRQGFEALGSDSASFSFKIHSGTVQIAGITGDFYFNSLHEPVGPAFFHLLGEGAWNGITEARSTLIKISAGNDMEKTVSSIKSAFADYNGEEPVDAVFADSAIQKWYEKETKISKMIMAFSLLTLTILMMGILAMALYFVRLKRKEIGIRKINGATENEIMQMLNMNYIRLILITSLLAVPLSYFIMHRWLENFAYKTTLSWWIFALAVIFIMVLSLAFVSWQSWKASTANPVESLKIDN